MSATYRAVQWNPQKRRYDALLWAGIAGYLGIFIGTGLLLDARADAMTLAIRATASGALLMLNGILCIGPLARLDRRFLPVLYNRRHLGVSMFLVATVHVLLVLVQFHADGNLHPLLSLLSAGAPRTVQSPFPFEVLGAGAWLILLLMAATSHDFWLANLTAPVWKALHMGVYLAYALLMFHVALGVLQQERAPLYALLLVGGALVVCALHVVAALRERDHDRDTGTRLVEVARLSDIPDQRAIVVTLSGERVAVFRDGARVCALSSVCRHQNGPLGEGRIVDGLITCPWHGYQYRIEDGCSPPPFTEKVPTFRVSLDGDRVFVDPRPLPPGTPTAPARSDA